MLKFNNLLGGVVALVPSAVQALETLFNGDKAVGTLAVVAGHAVQLAHDFEDVFAAITGATGAKVSGLATGPGNAGGPGGQSGGNGNAGGK